MKAAGFSRRQGCEHQVQNEKRQLRKLYRHPHGRSAKCRLCTL